MLSKAEINRLVDNILLDFKADIPKNAASSEIEHEFMSISEAPCVKSEFAAEENRKRKNKEILETAAGAVPTAKSEREGGSGGIDGELAEKDRRSPLIEEPQDIDALRRMMSKTTARIGVGRAGPRLKTQTLLKLRADHAAARDAVMLDVSEKTVSDMGLFSVKTLCEDKNIFLTRPDLGRDFSDETKKSISDNCKHDIDVQIIISDGLSSSSIEANASKILPVVTDGLKEKGISFGTPIFVKYGRVAAQPYIRAAEC